MRFCFWCIKWEAHYCVSTYIGTGKSTQVFVLFYFVLFILSYLIRRLTNPTDEGSSFPISWLLKDPSSNMTTLKLEFQYVSSGCKYLVGNGKRVNCPKFLIEVKLEEVFKLTDNDFRCLKPSVMNWTEAYWKAPKPIVALLPWVKQVTESIRIWVTLYVGSQRLISFPVIIWVLNEMPERVLLK